MSWNTEDEMAAINLMASEKRRASGRKPSIHQCIAMLNNWLDHADIREWDRTVNVDKCRAHANKVLESLYAQLGN